MYENMKKGTDDVLDASTQIAYLSSAVGRCLFYPWLYDPACAEFACTGDGKAAYEDADGLLALSPEQEKALERWARPAEALQARPNMGLEGADEIYQCALEDCSVVASLISAIHLMQRMGRPDVLLGRVFPQDEAGRPVVNPSGEYAVKLHFNGMERLVRIDDQLPKGAPGRPSLFVTSDRGILWPVLLEKAYMKVMGGYDFEGSHAAEDTFVLTGWIPEYVSFREYFEDVRASPDALWRRLRAAWATGDVMACVGTGSVHEAAILRDLVADHDYAVIDIREEADGRRMVQVRNPWVQGVPPGTPEAVKAVATGAFWVPFETLCSRFESLYLNWNPDLFVFQKALHFVWGLGAIRAAAATRSHCKAPQFVVANDADDEVVATLLVMRHFDGASSDVGAFSVALYEGGFRLVVPEDSALVCRTTAMNTRYSTLRVTIPPRTTYTAVVCCTADIAVDPAAQSNASTAGTTTTATEPPAEDTYLRFTMTVYASRKIQFGRARKQLAHTISHTSAWTRDQSGGRWSLPTYLSNPQFKLCVDADSPATRIYVLCEDTVPVNGQLFWSGGKQLHSITERDRIAHSGEYRQGSCVLSIRNLRRGEYTFIASAFDAGVTTPFTIVLASSAPLRLVRLPEINSGLFLRTAALTWGGHNRVEVPFHVGRSSPVEISFQVDDSHPSTPSAATSPVSSAYRPHVRLCIFDGPHLVATNGSFDDPTPNIFLKHHAAAQRQYVVVAERMEAGQGAFTIRFYADSPAVIG